VGTIHRQEDLGDIILPASVLNSI